MLKGYFRLALNSTVSFLPLIMLAKDDQLSWTKIEVASRKNTNACHQRLHEAYGENAL